MQYLMWSLYFMLSNSPTVPVDNIKVMVIDTGVNRMHPLLKDPWRVIAVGEDAVDRWPFQGGIGHGTHTTGLVLYGNSIKTEKLDKLCDEVTVYHCKAFAPEIDPVKGTVRCLSLADTLNIEYINYSGGGDKPDNEEKDLIKKLVDKKVVFVAAAGNNSSPLKQKKYYPASYKDDGINITVVGNGNSLMEKNPNSNWDNDIVWREGNNITSCSVDGTYCKMSGTSMAAPIYLHEILKSRCEKNKVAKKMSSK